MQIALDFHGFSITFSRQTTKNTRFLLDLPTALGQMNFPDAFHLNAGCRWRVEIGAVKLHGGHAHSDNSHPSSLMTVNMGESIINYMMLIFTILLK